MKLINVRNCDRSLKARVIRSFLISTVSYWYMCRIQFGPERLYEFGHICPGFELVVNVRLDQAAFFLKPRRVDISDGI